MPELALERITHTRLGQWSLSLPGGEQILVDVRRQPGTGSLSMVTAPQRKRVRPRR